MALAVFSVVINQNITMQNLNPSQHANTPTGTGEPPGPHPELGAPYLAGSYSWCPPQRMLGQGQVGRSWCHRKLLAMPNPVLISSPLLQVFWVFLDTGFPVFHSGVPWSFCLQAALLPEKQFGISVLWALLGSPATHPLMVLLLPWQVEHPGSLPWAGWARTPRSCNFLWTPTLTNKPELVDMSYIAGKNAGYYDWLL